MVTRTLAAIVGACLTSSAWAGCPGDVNATGSIDVNDLLIVISNWGPCDGCAADINSDNDVNVSDLLTVISGWGPCPKPPCPLGETIILFDNIGRAAPGEGVGPFNADPAATAGTTAYISAGHEGDLGFSRWLAIATFRPPYRVRLESVEMVLAQSDPSGGGEFDFTNPAGWPNGAPNFAVHIFEHADDLNDIYMRTLYRLCFGMPDPEKYPIAIDEPFNHNHAGFKNYLLGWDVDEDDLLTNVPEPPSIDDCANSPTVILEAGKVYYLGVFAYLNMNEFGVVGTVSSTREENDLLDFRHVFYAFPTVSPIVNVDPQQNYKLAYMARGTIIDCCEDPTHCPCLYPPAPNSCNSGYTYGP